MKKSLFTILILLALCLGACSSSNDATSSEVPSAVTESSETTRLEESSVDESSNAETKEETDEVSVKNEKQYFSFTPHYIRTGFDDKQSFPYAVMVDSSAELTSYYLTNKSPCGLGDSFKKAISTYDVEFFNSKVIVFVALMENSGSIKHEVKEVFMENDALVVNVERIVPEVGTDDMAGWHVILELDNSCITAKDNIVINING